jgi:PAS domain S-box-containing protein
VATRTLDVAGSALTVQVGSTPAFEAETASHAAPAALTAGLLLTALLTDLAHLSGAARAHAEARAREMTAELDRLAMVALHTSNAVVITDAERRITWVTEGFERVTGFAFDEAVGRSPGALLQFEGTDPGEVERLRRALDAGEGFRGELLNRSKAGRRYWVEIEVQPLRDAEGRVSGFVAIESEVTASREAAAALARERERLG